MEPLEVPDEPVLPELVTCTLPRYRPYLREAVGRGLEGLWGTRLVAVAGEGEKIDYTRMCEALQHLARSFSLPSRRGLPYRPQYRPQGTDKL